MTSLLMEYNDLVFVANAFFSEILLFRRFFTASISLEYDIRGQAFSEKQIRVQYLLITVGKINAKKRELGNARVRPGN